MKQKWNEPFQAMKKLAANRNIWLIEDHKCSGMLTLVLTSIIRGGSKHVQSARRSDSQGTKEFLKVHKFETRLFFDVIAPTHSTFYPIHNDGYSVNKFK